MARLDIEWAVTDLISVFDQARNLGFDLKLYHQQSAEVQAAMKKVTIDRIVQLVRGSWRNAFEGELGSEHGFNQIRNGVYVISIGGGFGVRYRLACSEVMYIGRGIMASRIRTHLKNWIFDMSLSLRDVPFRFYMESVGDKRSPGAFKDFEHKLLDEFSEKFGEKPLVNKIHGRTGRIAHDFSGDWKSPLDNRGKHYLWQVRPTKQNSWFREFEDA